MPRSRGPHEVSAGGVVVRPAGTAGPEVALVRAGRYWGFPKGKVERGETPVAAALREIEEEIGLPREGLEVIAELPPSEYVYRRQSRLIFKLVHQFLVAAPEGSEITHQAEEIDEAGWFTVDAAEATVSFDDSRRALAAAREILSGLRAS